MPLIAFGLALAGQLLLSRARSWPDGLLLYLVAIVLFVAWLRRADPAPLRAGDAHGRSEAVPRPSPLPTPEDEGGQLVPAGSSQERRRPRWAVQARLLVGFLGVTAFLGFGGNVAHPLAIVALLGAVLAYLYLRWEPGTGPRPSFSWLRLRMGRAGLQLKLGWEGAALLAVLALAAGLRFAQLDTLPAEMTSDHAEKFLDIAAIQAGARPIFFPANAGREGAQFYLAALLAGLTGYTFLTLKLVTCAASLAAIPFVAALGRLLGGPSVGLVAAFLLAISAWDLGIARFATRASFGVLWSAVALFLVYRALLTRERNTWLLLGLALGLGLYGYTSFRILPLFVGLLAAAFALLDARGRADRRELLGGLLAAYGLMALLALPLLRYALDFPHQFLFRTATRLTEAEVPLPAPAPWVLLGNLANTALMFNWQGDRSWVQQAPGQPLLDWVTGPLFVLGVLLAAYQAVRRRDLVAASLVAGLFVLTLPSALALAFPIEHPHQNRANPVLPLTMALAALPVGLGAEWLKRQSPGWRRLWVGAGVVLALAALQANIQAYFVDYRAVHAANTQNHKEVAAVVRGFAELFGTTEGVYLPVWPHWVDHRLVALEAGDFAWRERALIQRPEDAAAHASRPGPKLYILHHDNREGLETLRRIYPAAIITEHRSAKPGRGFRTVFVPG